jgi:excisionase family DNA binding protein
MFDIMDKNEKYCTSKEAASLLGVTARTIQLWEASGILLAWKTAGGHRRFNLTDIELFKKQLNKEEHSSDEPRLIRILVIEDEPDIIMLYKMTIKGWKLPVILETASDGFEGLIQIGAWKPDIIIADIQMPNMSGSKMLMALSKMQAFNDMMVMVVSGLSKAEINEKGGLPLGIPLFAKPIPFDEIEKIVEQRCKKLAGI